MQRSKYLKRLLCAFHTKVNVINSDSQLNINPISYNLPIWKFLSLKILLILKNTISCHFKPSRMANMKWIIVSAGKGMEHL